MRLAEIGGWENRRNVTAAAPEFGGHPIMAYIPARSRTALAVFNEGVKNRWPTTHTSKKDGSPDAAVDVKE